jgi:hypothetical protein
MLKLHAKGHRRKNIYKKEKAASTQKRIWITDARKVDETVGNYAAACFFQ